MRISIGVAILAAVVLSSIDQHGIGAQNRPQAVARARALEMFARSYFPGRSGQIMIVPGEGSIVVSQKDPVVKFMHGSPWPYDSRIPLLLYGAPYVRKGTYAQPARQQDVMPTMARVLDVVVPPTVTGRPLVEALVARAGAPRVVLVAVLDGMRLDYFDRHAALMPVLSRLRRDGAWFTHAEIDYLPTITGLGHTTVSTGTDPRYHGTTGNSMFDRVAHKPQETYAGNSPRDLMVLNLADVWNLHTRGRAVIIAQGSSGPAAIGLAGHGGCLFGAQRIRAAAYSRQSGAWTSNEACYDLPAYVAQRNAREVWERAGGTWMGQNVANADSVRRTSLFARFEADTVMSMIEGEGVGADETADLVLVNFKTPDFVAHQYGPDSPQLRETLAELDREFGRVLALIEQKAKDRFVVGITADHGMPGEPSGKAVRVFSEDVIKAVHDRFDPGGRLVQQYEPESSQLAIDIERLAELRHSLNDVARFLEQQPFVFAAFTEDEVRRAAAIRPRVH
jgi:Type I phosphodiesterase / nucleotide pyrophosphatase